MGRQHQVLRIVFFGTLVFHSSALLLIPSIGAMGANIAQVLLAAICAVSMDRLWLREIAAYKVVMTGLAPEAGPKYPSELSGGVRTSGSESWGEGVGQAV